MLSEDLIRSLSQGENGTYIFDFSTIPSSKYEQLLRSLQHFAKSKIVTIGFNTDTLTQLQQSKSIKNYPQQVQSSIALNKSHFISNILELLVYILPRSTKLMELNLSTLNFRQNQLIKLFEAIKLCKSLKTIKFNDIPIGNDGLRSLLKMASPDQISSISVLDCQLTDNVTDAIVEFINRKKSQTYDGIASFEVSNKEFSEECCLEISEALKKKMNSANPAASPEVMKLRQENQQLKAELARLRQSVNAVQYNERVYVIGKNASQFVQFLRGIDQTLNHLEEQKKMINEMIG